MRGTGARGLRAIMEEVLLSVMYEVPSLKDIARVVVTREVVLEHVNPTLVPRESTQARAPREVRHAPATDRSARPGSGPLFDRFMAWRSPRSIGARRVLEDEHRDRGDVGRAADEQLLSPIVRAQKPSRRACRTGPGRGCRDHRSRRREGVHEVVLRGGGTCRACGAAYLAAMSDHVVRAVACRWPPSGRDRRRP